MDPVAIAWPSCSVVVVQSKYPKDIINKNDFNQFLANYLVTLRTFAKSGYTYREPVYTSICLAYEVPNWCQIPMYPLFFLNKNLRTASTFNLIHELG